MGKPRANMRSLCLALLLATALAAAPPSKLFSCSNNTCVLLPRGAATGSALPVCLLTCGVGPVWPLPSKSTMDGTVSAFSRCNISWQFSASAGVEVKRLLTAAGDHLVTSLAASKQAAGSSCKAQGQPSLTINFDVASQDQSLTSSSDESYTLRIAHHSEHESCGCVAASRKLLGGKSKGCSCEPMAYVTAPHFAGAMHALQTLAQLTAYDASRGMHVVAHAVVDDSPAFVHRGILVDTGRQFLPIPQLLKTIRAMAMNKMNVMHMHISDTASFPIELSTGSAVNVTSYGAYGPDEYYTAQQIRDLVAYAKEHAVRVIPEIDAPGHANEGWQWGEEAGLGELALCRSGWTDKALEPPGGQLNIVNPNLYPVLDAVYHDIVALFQSDVFHLGGDEVIVGTDKTFASCWNNTEQGAPILQHLKDLGMDRNDPQSFYKLWANFTNQAAAGVRQAYKQPGMNASLSKMLQWGGSETAPSSVTYNLVAQPYVKQVLPPAEFIIQVWDVVNGSIAADLLKEGYEVLLSHTDYVYLDCGEPGWVKPGGYWCEPLHEWFKMYGYINDVKKSWGLKDLTGITGAETLAWGEGIDEHNFDPKVWPRTAALAEALWSNPSTGWWEAKYRMHQHRQRMVDNGIDAEAMQTHWCLFNDGCDVNSGIPQ